MKKILVMLFCIPFFIGCAKLDLNPLSEGSTENWFSDEVELTLALNDLYREYVWSQETNLETERMTDNWTQRQAVNAYAAGTVSSDFATSAAIWQNTYKGIARANKVLNNMYRAEGNVSAIKMEQLAAEAHFFRAAFYSRLIFHYGDVPYYTNDLTIEEAFQLHRTDKATILKEIYKDFDLAINSLPISYGSNDVKRITKGAAYAFKARIALYMQDYVVARDAAKACMDLKAYTLHADFGNYFLSSTKNSTETIFAVPRSAQLGSTWATTNFFPRTAGGSAVAQPSWELLCSFTCTDGLPIDRSPLYDPHRPFANRDPRCAQTIVEFGTEFLGFVYDPNPYVTTVLNVSTGKQVANKDNRAVDQFGSYNGLTLKKGVDLDWSNDLQSDFDIIIMRYADVLMMYAEAKMELNEIDDDALKAINTVRARAYRTSVDAVSTYPAITTKDQTALRTIVRNERRMEFAWENRRYDDIIRWKIAGKSLTKPIYGMLDVADLKKKVVDRGLWFFPGTPSIDADGLPDFTAMYNAGLIKLLVKRAFDPDKQYLWPIPSAEIRNNPGLGQNHGY